MKKILIAYATAGIGHKKAAMAVKAALDEMAPRNAQVTMIDALDYTNAFFKWTYLKAYLLMVNKLPSFWGISYYLTNNRCLNIVVSILRRFNNWLNSKKLAEYLIAEKYDVIISTHFFASEVISDLKKRGALNSRLVTIVTDYRLHSWWVADRTDIYVVAGRDAKDDFAPWRVDPERIKVLGIPVEPVFSRTQDRAKILETAQFKDGVFTILVIGGGFGVGPIEDIIKVIGGVSSPLQVTIVCGHNEELVKKIEALKSGMRCRMNILGFVNNVYDYMEISDVLISKSGGITVTESLAKDLPVIVIAPIIGQETRNADFIVKHGAAVKLARVSDLKGLIEDLASSPEKCRRMKDSIRAIKRPSACYDVAKLAIELAGA